MAYSVNLNTQHNEGTAISMTNSTFKIKRMAKTAVAFAVKHKIALGQDVKSGHYYIVDHENGTRFPGGSQLISDLSLFPTARSAIIMMKRYLRRREVA